MKKALLLSVLLIPLFLISCGEKPDNQEEEDVFDGKVKETGYWAETYTCLELTPEGSANFYETSSGKTSLAFSMTYRIEKNADGDILNFSGPRTESYPLLLFGAVVGTTTTTTNYGPGRFDKSRSQLKIPVKKTITNEYQGTTDTNIEESELLLSKTTVGPH